VSFLDTLFGGESMKGIYAQQEDNAARQDFIERQAQLGRQDVMDIQPRGSEALQQGYRAATDVARRTPQAQTQVLQNASQRAQESLLSGMNEYRRAILGLPSQQNYNHIYNNPLGMRPQKLGVGANVPFYESQRPVFLGTRPEDQMEAAIRKNPDMLLQDPDWLAQAQALFPERFRSVTDPAGPSAGSSGAANIRRY
jgi:hypothetical protein